MAPSVISQQSSNEVDEILVCVNERDYVGWNYELSLSGATDSIAIAVYCFWSSAILDWIWASFAVN